MLESVKKNLSTTIQETGAEISASVLPVVQGEPVPLLLLFQNLVSNALKYRSKEKPRVKITATRAASHWLFGIEDNGIGIPRAF